MWIVVRGMECEVLGGLCRSLFLRERNENGKGVDAEYDLVR